MQLSIKIRSLGRFPEQTPRNHFGVLASSKHSAGNRLCGKVGDVHYAALYRELAFGYHASGLAFRARLKLRPHIARFGRRFGARVSQSALSAFRACQLACPARVRQLTGFGKHPARADACINHYNFLENDLPLLTPSSECGKRPRLSRINFFFCGHDKGRHNDRFALCDLLFDPFLLFGR
jgi:hypothetical protein